ncbi:MAG: pyruvate, phosphate dikinase [Acidobacteria bacterium RIFCSPHIGHO2_12_FULL_67_30]|nr:MAG: pyruvate, phosphate dikinase [Acidobacteria bacterium RIFCSPHIGHO2_02_FULL_67_57]OFV85963.1 MAG: pyruvate, phosphate dikinase [Acidobacteria bacterium RIFCSPHIGHO2_01_FULL_67_28]OFV86748.1 MAG: pyruvate, phosphate dikinase [Acidobacteria bacterium RIFCSPHIGHO2_12_FULL_67_30]
MAKKHTKKPAKAPKGKFVYFFGGGRADGRGDMKELLGGKGAGLAEMTNARLPVPPGFTIATSACRHFFEAGNRLGPFIERQVEQALERLEKMSGCELGSKANPLLVSVRSGAKFSMPGMMDTILNLGLNDDTVQVLARRTQNPRFAQDCYRRFIQMFGNIVLGIKKEEFEHLFDGAKKENRARLDTELTAEALAEVVRRYNKLVQERTGKPFPQEPRRQLALARDAVFRSWNNPRARTYRKMHKISESLGTAVNVQMMVFGNLGERSATGVGFTRNPSTGAKEFYGEFLQNAQGEDVVAGIRTPQPVAELEKLLPEAYRQLRRIAGLLERHYRDMQDFEYTIQDRKLYMLQTRTGKRTGRAALKIAYDMVKEKLITPREAVMRVEPAQLEQLLHPIIDDSQPLTVIAKGLPASPGAAVGKVVFTADEAALRGRSEPVILVRAETVPDDIHGMDAAAGILTARGGMTSHAAVVARGMGKCCVAGCETIRIQEAEGVFSVDSHRVKEGDWISLDGTTGRVILGQARTINPDPATGEFAEFMKWADRERRLGVRANADIPRDAQVARRFGAEGIGLCRTEHMFFAEERLPHVQAMILADTEASRRQALAKLLPMQREDFKGLFREMDGFPVTIRLLDPPLHEFLPKREVLMVEIERLKGAGKTGEVAEKERLLERVEQLHEFNPMLGHRGCRLGISYPEISEMQARAIFEAACEVAAEGVKVLPEVMIPLVGHVRELTLQKELVEKVAAAVFAEKKRRVEYLVGTMIELPRAAVTADQIAAEAQFFSFGTNDLTQTTFGFSRDDTGRIIREYEQLGILADDPFQVLDAEGVGVLVRMGTELGRRARPNLKVGICGEHGGDPASVEFCHQIGLNYVSCSPYRVPVARLAAAQAAIKERLGLVEGVARTA